MGVIARRLQAGGQQRKTPPRYEREHVDIYEYIRASAQVIDVSLGTDRV